MACNASGLEFGSTARLSKRPGSVWNCLWGHALQRSPGINRKSRVSYPGLGFLSSATWPLLQKKHYNGLNQTKPLYSERFYFEKNNQSEWSSQSNFLYWKRLTCGRQITCRYLKMMLFYSETKKMKYFLDPPPKKKSAQGYEWLQYDYTHMCLFIAVACDLDFY